SPEENKNLSPRHGVNIVYTYRSERKLFMATNQKNPAGRGPVVSVRLEPELIERLDALAERTKRSRGTYLRMALWAALPELERIHWEQAAADFEELAIKDAFEEITQQLMDEASKLRKSD
ncbi:ribbon-helix-helix protein, CopG family, partial [Bacillus velezensis]